MKTARVSFFSLALGLCVLVSSAFAVSHLITVSSWDSPPWKNGTIYSVPSGAGYEWEVSGSAHILVGGGGLNVNAYGSNYDVGNTAYADDISYQLSAYGDGGYALLYVGW